MSILNKGGLISTPCWPLDQTAASIADTSKYWGDLASSKLDWFTPFTHVQNGSFNDGTVSWFLNGKLNTTYNAIDRWCLSDKDNRADSPAIIWEGDEPNTTRTILFSELLIRKTKVFN